MTADVNRRNGAANANTAAIAPVLALAIRTLAVAIARMDMMGRSAKEVINKIIIYYFKTFFL